MCEKLKYIRAVLFDMDGVIFDTERLAYEGWMQAGKILNIPITKDQLDQNRGSDIRAGRIHFKEWFGSDFPYEEARQIRTNYIETYIEKNGAPVKAGIREFFAFLKEAGIKKAIATSSQRKDVERYFKSAALPFDFDASVCGTEIQISKPAPDIFLKAAGQLCEEPRNCLVVEDSTNGVKAGVAAGCHVAMVPDLTMPDEEMRQLCDLIVDNVLQIKRYL